MKKFNLLFALLLILNSNSLLSQNFIFPKLPVTIGMSGDLTAFGAQGRIACDVKMPELYEVGLSVAYLGMVNYGDRNTLVFDSQDYRLNISIRALKHYDLAKWAKPFVVAQFGISHNNLQNFILGGLYLPSFRFGVGMDFQIIQAAGIRLEVGVGSPYVASAGVFFKL